MLPTAARRRGVVAGAVAVAVLAGGAGVWGVASTGEETTAPIEARELRVEVAAEHDGTPVTLDADLYLPESPESVPAVLLAHGFGGSKRSVAADARRLAAEGYAVLAYSARGFGDSGGRIHLNDPDLEVADASRMLDTLAAQDAVLLDGEGDPRVAVVGGSYGGALALMAAGTDPRVDSVVAMVTWHDLADAFFPQHAGTPSTDPFGPMKSSPEPGPFKQLWASAFFGSGAAAGSLTSGSDDGSPTSGPEDGSPTSGPEDGSPTSGPEDGSPTSGAAGADTATEPDTGERARASLCGSFDPQVCALFLGAAETGEADPQLLDLLRAHSPAPFLDRIGAPVYLIQGMSDTLFGVEHAEATARALQQAGTPVAVRWFNGGHDGDATAAAGGPAGGVEQDPGGGPPAPTNSAERAAAAEREQQDDSIARWLEATLSDAATSVGAPSLPVPAFTYTLPHQRGQDVARTLTVPEYTALAGPGTPGSAAGRPPRSGDAVRWVQEVPLDPSGRAPAVLNPPGGIPAAITAVPGLGGLGAGAPTYQLAALPGQHVAFDTEPLEQSLVVAGSPRVSLEVTSSGEQTTLFVSLWQVQGQTASLPRRLVAPVRVETTPGQPQRVDVALPAATWELTAGSTWRVLVSATDTAYRNATEARVDRVSLADPVLVLPALDGVPAAGPAAWDGEALGVAAAILALLAALGLFAWRRQAHPAPVREDLAAVPLVIEGLTKRFPDGHLAVDDVSWRAEQGQVVGLLGPNGAGKTTTLRMVAGLVHPDAGEVHVMGEPVRPGAPVLRRVGMLVEGPGFLPHLSGRENLRAYWAATGRPEEEAAFDEALRVAALGGAADRPVRAYSHGMKQRLGIAQAMLGLPEVLILDEPTNGLDPPQIAAMRPILRRYAEGGRTVIISSHLLAEVELTCSHVVVMHAGRVVAAGSVSDVGVDSGHTLEEVFLSTIAGIGSVPEDAVARTERLRQVRPR